VGKTYAAEQVGDTIARTTHQAFARFNMNEYKERHELSRMIGAPPGFIGHEDAGALFRYAHTNPRGVILLDEIDKAHPEVRDYFLQVFDSGQTRDSRGRMADFRPFLFLLTCKAPEDAIGTRRLGFTGGNNEGGATPEATVRDHLSTHLGAELLGRVDRVVVFRSLTMKDFQAMFSRAQQGLNERLAKETSKTVSLTPTAKEHLMGLMTSHKEGARGFLHRFEQLLASPVLVFAIGAPDGKDAILVDWNEGGISLAW
jgi:ATP-dependent Clp protease ATP-binding subunit ClpC